MTNALALATWPAPDRADSDLAKELQREFAQARDSLQVTETFGAGRRALDAAFWSASVADWDGEGAPAVSVQTYRVARRFLAALPPSIPTPVISIDPDGEVSFTWVRRRGAILAVSLGPDAKLSFAGIYDSKPNYGEDSFFGEIPEAVRINLARLFPQGTAQAIGAAE